MLTDIEIARAARPRPIGQIGAALGVPEDALIPYGRDKAKIDRTFLADLETSGRADGALVLVTAMSPTPAGEGKTTTTVGLGDALSRIGKHTAICLREPSLGPCFGMKGGAAGGGYAQVIPMEAINLHFTGDFHAITSAHNLLAALIDNHIYWRRTPRLDPRHLTWRRVMDMNDRSLRQIASGLGGNGVVLETGFDITVASEVMAILCLARDLADLETRLARIRIGEDEDGVPVTAGDLGAAGAMAVLLADAVQPNLVQTLEGTPALIHGGPFANIAHGCNSVIATRAALRLADYVVTEAGFGADLGAEKFFDIKCRQADLTPAVAVVVATIRSLKMNGGVARDALGEENVEALIRGCANLGRHIANVRRFGVPVVVAVNHFSADTAAETAALEAFCASEGVEAVICRHWAEGGPGAEALARRVVAIVEDRSARFAPLYEDSVPLWGKIETVARTLYGAGRVTAEGGVKARLKRWGAAGFDALPVCMAKTQYSFSTDPSALGAPSGHELRVREVRLAAGAGFVVAICGDMMTMPGLPKYPAAQTIGLDSQGRIDGLF